MKLMSLIFAGVVCCSPLVEAVEEANFSLWPRRPDELEQARRLLKLQKWGEVVHLLQPFVHEAGVVGQESRQMTAFINVPRYLSRLHPGAKVYAVKRGDTMPKISVATGCPVDILMLINGLTDPSNLKIGQSLVYLHMGLRVEIYPLLNELCVWDDSTLVASYRVLSMAGISESELDGREVSIKSRDSYIQGKSVPAASVQSAVADRKLRLTDGTVIIAESGKSGRYIELSQKDLNELSQLVIVGNKVVWRQESQPYTTK